MPKGVEVTLYDAAGAAIANETGIEVAWFDVDAVASLDRPRGTLSTASTDASGKLALDLNRVSGLAVGGWGFLLCYKPDGSDYKDSPVFASRVQVATISAGTEIYPPDPWVRPAAWLAMPDLTGLQKFAGLFAVYPESNHVALVAAGAYKVNWGDGSADQSVSSGVQAQKDIAWADAPASSDVGIADAVACTFTESGDTVNRTAHGFKNGEAVAFNSITSTTGISTYTTYYVVSAAADTFKLASSIGGSALPLTTDGSGSVYRPVHRQVIITVWPNGGNLTSLNLYTRHSARSTNYGVAWLDIEIAGPNLTTLSISGNSSQVTMSALQRVSLYTPAINNFTNLFYGCRALARVQSIDASSGTNFSNMFSTCAALVSVPLFNTSSGTNFSNMFSWCSSLTNVPLFNTSSGTNFSGMFNGCSFLADVPLLNTSSGTNFSGMFGGCSAILSVPLFDTSSGTDFNGMFSGCYSLVGVPLFNTASGTAFNNMFRNCYSIVNVPAFNTASGTNFNSMFYVCSALANVPLLNTASGTNFNSMFYGCLGVVDVPLLNTASGTDLGNMFNGCQSLSFARLAGTAQNISYQNCNLGAAALDEIYTGLATVSSKTITVSGNWGTASDTPSIATTKGWTVTG